MTPWIFVGWHDSDAAGREATRRGGTLAARLGPRVPLTAGSFVCALALLLATRIGADASYLTDVLPVVLLVGIGLPLVTPAITATVLTGLFVLVGD